MKFQIAVIGGGVIGSAIAWTLSHYNISTIVFEMGSDVASGASKANSGVIHSGINSPPSSLKAKFCVEGNRMMESLSKELGFQLKWVGKYVVAKKEDEIEILKDLQEVGRKNGVPGLEILDGKEVKKREPYVNCKAALWVPTAGIVSPYEMTIAFAENAAENGVTFMLETKVIGLRRKEEGFVIKTTKGEFFSQVLINAAGIYCRDIVSMLQQPDFEVYPCRGEYLVLDKNYKYLVNSMIYPVPEDSVLGVHITPTLEGNILLGPSAEFIEDTDTSTTKKMMKVLYEKAREIIPSLPESAITAYSGIRCKIAKEWADYRIEEDKGFINLLGIESPGLTASPAIAKEVISLVSKTIELKEKKSFTRRKRRKRFCELTLKEQASLIRKDPLWGRIICRCENVTEREVIDALSNPLGAKTISSVKYRCRAGMGRCQGGFCTQHIVRIMQQYFNIDPTLIKLKSPGSYLFKRRIREG
jgi:glycerol-3-phosphate dehydrogenase